MSYFCPFLFYFYHCFARQVLSFIEVFLSPLSLSPQLRDEQKKVRFCQVFSPICVAKSAKPGVFTPNFSCFHCYLIVVCNVFQCFFDITTLQTPCFFLQGSFPPQGRGIFLYFFCSFQNHRPFPPS